VSILYFADQRSNPWGDPGILAAARLAQIPAEYSGNHHFPWYCSKLPFWIRTGESSANNHLDPGNRKMNQLLEYMYYRSPVVAQNCAISLMGWKLRRERYAPEGERMLETLRRTQNYSKEVMLEYQGREFVRLARHAMTTTPYYRSWASDCGIRPEHITSADDIRHFPIIRKEVVRSNPELFRSDKPLGTPVTLYTSGTTGTPLKVFTDSVSRSRHYAFFSRIREWYGVRSIDKRATLFGRIIMPSDEKRPPFWRYDASQRNLLMSSYHLKSENLPHYYQKLVDFRPVEIFSYPSSLAVLARYIVENDLEPLKLNLVMTTAENLLESQRQLIRAAFDAPLVNQYGCTEMAFFAASDQSEEMYFHPEHGMAEVVADDGSVAWQGDGEFIATGLINYSMPIIRYAVGDEISLGDRSDNGFVRITSLSGRTDDTVFTKDGTPVGRLDPVFKGGSGIQLAQIEQIKSGDIIVRLVPDKYWDSSKGESIKFELARRLGRETNVSIVLCDSIDKESNGKFRSVKSRFHKEERLHS
jgi:phenylacetate-CoA ligase